MKPEQKTELYDMGAKKFIELVFIKKESTEEMELSHMNIWSKTSYKIVAQLSPKEIETLFEVYSTTKQKPQEEEKGSNQGDGVAHTKYMSTKFSKLNIDTEDGNGVYARVFCMECGHENLIQGAWDNVLEE